MIKNISRQEKTYLRDLAKEQLELSQLPLMQKRVHEWTLHNSLQGQRPMIHFEMRMIADKGFNPECKCESESARIIERTILSAMANHKMVGDDRVVTNDFVCHYKSQMIPFNMRVKREETGGVGFHIINQIESLDSLEQIKPSLTDYDIEGSYQWKDFVKDIIGDILNVRMGMNGFYVCLTNDIVHRMGMENMFMSIYDNPDNFHYMMNSLSDDYVAHIKELQQRGMICANNKNDFVAQGSFGFCRDLPDNALKTSDCWGYMDSQETVGIGADMFDEFFFPYYKKVADYFGLLSYGCCEPVHGIWRSLSKFTNLRKISISPWCDEEYMGEALRGRDVIYLRKPSPNYIGVGKNLDEADFREHVRKTLYAANGCKLEFAFRDVYTLDGNLSKPKRVVAIVREEIENLWR